MKNIEKHWKNIKSRFGAPCGRRKRWSSISKLSCITPGQRIAKGGVGRLLALNSSKEILSAPELRPNSLARLLLQHAMANCWPASEIKDASRSVQWSRLPDMVQMPRSCLFTMRLHWRTNPQMRGCDVNSPLIAEQAILSLITSSSLARPPFMIAVKRPTISSRFWGIELTQTPREGFTMVETKSLYLSVADESDMQLWRTHCCNIGVSSFRISSSLVSLCLNNAVLWMSCMISFTAPSPWNIRALRSCAAQNFRANRRGALTTSRCWCDMKWYGSLKLLQKEGLTKHCYKMQCRLISSIFPSSIAARVVSTHVNDNACWHCML